MTNSLSNIPPLLDRMDSALHQNKEDNDRQFVTALGRGLMLLTAFEHQEVLSHQQLCQMTKLPKATITRLIHTLTILGFLRITEYGHYQLGSSAMRLSATAWSRHDMVAAAEPLLRQFARENEVSVNLATEIGGKCAITHAVVAPRASQSTYKLAQQYPWRTPRLAALFMQQAHQSDKT
ncbi:hypothetical protein Psyaliredsea_22050 [Psychrobacter alimentarius]